MNASERGQLIRKRFRALGGVIYVPSGHPPKAKHERRKNGFGLPCFGIQGIARNTNWFVEAEAKPKFVPQPKRTARKSALTKIAEQLPRKLPRVLFPL